MAYAGSVVTESLTCSICCELLNEPKLLACTHTFCEKCLHRLFSSKGEQTELPCPSCREITHLQKGDISKLQTNVPIKSLLEQLKSARKFCTICAADLKSIALFYCWQCNEYLCASCHNAHGKFKKISHHDVVSVDDVKSGKVRAKHFCQMHPHEELEFVCSACKEPICFRCRILYHNGSEHQVVTIMAFQKTLQSQAKSLQEASEEKMSAIEGHIGQVEEHLVKAGSVLDERVAEIHEAYEECLQQLTKRRDELADEVQHQRQTMITELEGSRDVNVQLLARIKSLYETMTEAAEGFLDGDPLVAHNKTCQQLEEMLEKEDPDDELLKDIGMRAEGLKFRRCNGPYNFGRIGEVHQAYGDPSILSPHMVSIKGEMDWVMEKVRLHPISGANYCNIAPTPDGKMAVGYRLGGIDVFTIDGLHQTVLQNVKVMSVAVLSDGRYVVCDVDKNMSLYSCKLEHLSYLGESRYTLHVDKEDQVYIQDTEDTYEVSRLQSSSTELEFVREISDERYDSDCRSLARKENLQMHVGPKSYDDDDDDDDEYIGSCRHTYSVRVFEEDGPILFKRYFGERPLCIDVLHDETILIGWEEDGHVTIERYTYQLRFIKTVLTGYKIDGKSFQLRQFSTGEIALCDGKSLHVFRKAY